MNKTYFFLKSKPVICIHKIKRVQQGIAFSTVLYKNDVTDWPTSFFFRGKDQLYFVAVVE